MVSLRSDGAHVVTFEQVQAVCAALVGADALEEVVLIPRHPGKRVVILETAPDLVFRYEDAPGLDEDLRRGWFSRAELTTKQRALYEQVKAQEAERVAGITNKGEADNAHEAQRQD